LGRRPEVEVRVEAESDRAEIDVLETVEQWVDHAGFGSAEMWLGENAYLAGANVCTFNLEPGVVTLSALATSLGSDIEGEWGGACAPPTGSVDHVEGTQSDTGTCSLPISGTKNVSSTFDVS
jgi:hypothetical protein